MRILYLDIDALRPDHLGCYGYGRSTSPQIDAIAGQGTRLTQCYASDVPCGPSRSSLLSGRFGFRHGAVTHTGSRCQPFPAGPDAAFGGLSQLDTLPAQLRKAGHRTATISSFYERHHAYHAVAGFNDVIDPGYHGHDHAHDITPLALDWLDAHGQSDDWFLHINFWDVHNPYQVPMDFPDLPEPVTLPGWLTEDRIQQHTREPGIRSALDAMAFRNERHGDYPRQPMTITNTDDARALFDGYDIAVRYVDHHVGLIVERLRQLGVYDDTAIVIMADHGENLGELNSYGGHCTACPWTGRIPAIIRWPGRQAAAVHDGLRYHLDVGATIVDWAGAAVPDLWDGRPIDAGGGRDALVVSQLAQCCQRAVRFDHDGLPAMAVRTYQDGYYGWPEWMAFDLSADAPDPLPSDSTAGAAIIEHAEHRLHAWTADAASRSAHPDPLQEVLATGGEASRMRPRYLEHLAATGRSLKTMDTKS